jgi:hypothetical protein
MAMGYPSSHAPEPVVPQFEIFTALATCRHRGKIISQINGPSALSGEDRIHAP